MPPVLCSTARHASLAAFACAVLVGAGAAHAQMNPTTGMGQGSNPTFKPGPGPDELWETTFRMEMTGMSMPAQTAQSCIKKGRKDADLVPVNDECRTTDVKTTGNRTTFSMTCQGDPPMTGTGDITSTPNSYSGRMTMRSTRRGEEMTMTQTFSGKRIGTCTDTSAQFVAKVEADGKAQLAKACAEQMEALAPSMFEGSGPCAAQRKQFCDKAAGVANGMRDPAGHAAARRKYSANLMPAFQSCNQDYAAVSKTACAKAVETRNWNFVGSGPCDMDVRAHAPTYCNTGPNRSPDPQYFGLCSRYASLTRGTATADTGVSGAPGGASGTASAPAGSAASPPDPLKQGVDAVRRLLPF